MHEKWVVSAKKADFMKISEQFHIDPVTARLIRNRNIITEEEIKTYLLGDLRDLPSPWLMKDMDLAVGILTEKIQSQKTIRIIGDYDIDGVTATCILLKGLKKLGAQVDTYIPDRIADGYGLHMPLIEKAVQDGIDTIITCDNGIAAAREIAEAKKNGLTVIVTDHHDIPYLEEEGGRHYLIPAADAVINPKQTNCSYPYKNLCGAVVAWKLILALYDRLQISEQEQNDFLELAAIATVGDVMDLQGENRILVKEGLKRLPATSNYGLQALMKVCNLTGRISAYHIGFVLGPCLNASGRLDTANRSLNLLMAQSFDEAEELAEDLKAMNESRKALTEQGKEEAFHIIETTDLKKDKVLVVFLPGCHESLAGIIAGRIREKYYKPAFVLTKGEHMVKGSGRSIESYSMYEELNRCAELLEQFGGHPMAAGLSIEEKNVEQLRRKLNALCMLKEEDLTPKIVIDVPMPISYIKKSVIEELELLEPFGKGNVKPLFAQKGLLVIGAEIIGKNKNVVRMSLQDENGVCMKAVYFGEIEEFMKYLSAHPVLSVVYYPELNSYNGTTTIQLIIKNYR